MAHSPKSTAETLKKQLQLAIKGVKKPIGDLQTSTGVKDKVCEVFIEQFIKKRKEKHSALPRPLEAAVEQELQASLAANEENILNLFYTSSKWKIQDQF